MNRTLATWPATEADGPELRYESLDVRRMELPPGWRGYGERNHIDHPDTSGREAEVERLSANGDDRYAVQRALMPYEDLLPERYRGPNERLKRDYS